MVHGTAANDHSEHAGHDHAHGHHAAPPPEGGSVKDPVCGMTVDPHTSKHRSEHDGHPFYFCSNGCRTKFEADPVRYLDPAGAEAKAEAVPEGAVYTCPMHPQIRQVGPGSCPICGMALEPATVSGDDGPNEELVDMTRRFWVGARPDAAGVRPGDGRSSDGPDGTDRPAELQLEYSSRSPRP